MRVGKITVDLRKQEALSVEWWPVVRQNAKCITIWKPVKLRRQKKIEPNEVRLQRSRLWTVRVAKNALSATVFVTAEDGREDAAVRLALQGLTDELRERLAEMEEALARVEAAAGDGC